MIKSIFKKNRYKFLLSLIPVVIVGIMAPLRSYIMQLLIDSSNYRELLGKGIIAAAFSIGIFVFEWMSKKSQAIVVRDMEKSLRNQLMLENIREIRLDNVTQQISESFSLDKLTLTFEKGKKYAIVGKSGSGKSSIIKLLTEYGGDYTGRLLINGQELSGLNKESIMHISPVCYQQTYLFNDTVFNNVALYGSSGVIVGKKHPHPQCLC